MSAKPAPVPRMFTHPLARGVGRRAGGGERGYVKERCVGWDEMHTSRCDGVGVVHASRSRKVAVKKTIGGGCRNL